MANPIDTSLTTATAEGDVIPGPPSWMASDAVEEARRPRQPKQRKTNPSPSIVPAAEEDSIPSRTQVIRWLRSAAAKGYGLSLFVHLLLLLAMGLYIFPGLAVHNDITTVVESDTELPEEFDRLDDIQLDMPAGSEEVVQPQLTEMVEQDAELNLLEHEFLNDVTVAETEGEGGSTSGTGGGFRMLEPKNAVRKGSFTAWTVPIPQRFGEKPKAGESPRPGQAYFIAIQVKLQEGRRIYKVNDLSGKITGTDGYKQLIPAMAYVQEKNGKITRASIGRLLPIVDGVAQILIRVPGAEALVKDTINVKSRSLKEEQTLELEFGT